MLSFLSITALASGVGCPAQRGLVFQVSTVITWRERERVGFLVFFNIVYFQPQLYHEYLIFSVSPGGEGPQGGRTDSDDDGDDDHLWEWWHTMLIACIAVVIILGIVVVILIAVS